MRRAASAILVAGSIAVAFAAADATAQVVGAAPHRPAGMVDGVVTDTSLAPVADVTITIVGMELRGVTGANGRFRIVSVPAGDYVLLVRRIGYEATTARISVAERDTLRLSFALRPAVSTLDTVAVAARSMSPRLADFYERRKVGPGQFLTQNEIEAKNAVNASDLFRSFLGLHVTASGDSGYSLRDAPGRCPIMAIVDGFVRFGASGYPSYRELPSPKEISAIEFYAGPSEIPVQYKSTMRGTWCGLILIWTRDGS
jgi:hypothetical protein